MRSAFIPLVIALVIVFLVVRAVALRAGLGIAHAFRGGSSRVVTMQTSTPNVGAFHALVSNGAINVVLRQGTSTSLTFRAKAETLPKLKAEVVDGVLTIGTTGVSWNDNLGEVTATIETPDIDAVTLNGSGDIEVKDIKTSKLAVAVNGSGDITANGAADSASFDISGSGRVDAQHLVVDTVSSRINGSGEAHVNALKSLDASIAGSGDINYVGRPDIHQHIAGSGSVSPEGD